jgi:tetratricopeptide (TPR) repeat protein
MFVAASLILVTVVSGCSQQVSSVVARAVQGSDSSKDAPTLSKDAYDLILKDDYDAAIIKAELAIRKDATFGEAYKNLALAYCDSGRVAQALEPAQKAVMLSPRLDKAHYVLGKILFRLERFNEAVTELQEAIRINPKYDKAYFLLGSSFDLLNKPEDALAALNHAVQLQPDYCQYLRFRDYVAAYARQKEQTTLPIIVSVKGQPSEYSSSIYSGIFYEALIHHDFDLIEKAADAARASKEKLPGGVWKLRMIYAGLSTPYAPVSDHEWNQHINLLEEWTKRKPNSLTAKVALASTYVSFGWNARGAGFANTVSERNWELFYNRLDHAQDILMSIRSQQLCPFWYSVMQTIALAQGWDRETYEQLFAHAVQYEPTWYEYYKNKVFYLLPRWHGQPGELQAYVNSLATRRDRSDSAVLYFLVNEYAGLFEQNGGAEPAYPIFKQGFLQLRKAYGVTQQDVNWACFKALRSSDSAFAVELVPALKNDPNFQVWGDKQQPAFPGMN